MRHLRGYRTICCRSRPQEPSGQDAREPANVKRVLQKVRQEGIRTTLTQVSAKLSDPMPPD